jgi:hypothetical protein
MSTSTTPLPSTQDGHVTLDRDSMARAQQALLDQSTISAPAVSMAKATETLEAFLTSTGQVPSAELASKITPAIQTAAVAFLRWYLTPLSLTAREPGKRYRKVVAAAMSVVPSLPPARRADVLEALFNAINPAYFAEVAPTIQDTFTAVALHNAVRDKAMSKNELHALNALSLPYYLGMGRADLQLSTADRQLLAQRRDALRADPKANAFLKLALADVQF